MSYALLSTMGLVLAEQRDLYRPPREAVPEPQGAAKPGRQSSGPYYPHQSKREIERRKRQMARKQETEA